MEEPLFGPSLKTYLLTRIKQCGLTPAEIARRAKIAPAILYRFINGQRDLSLETIDKLLPVIDAEIQAKIEAMTKRFDVMMAERHEVLNMFDILRGMEDSIVRAIGGGMNAVGVLALMRMLTGNDLDEATKERLKRLWEPEMMEEAERIRLNNARLIKSRA